MKWGIKIIDTDSDRLLFWEQTDRGREAWAMRYAAGKTFRAEWNDINQAFRERIQWGLETDGRSYRIEELQ